MKNNIKLIMSQIADWITRNGNRKSLITLTRAAYSDDHKKLQIFYTVIPENQEAPALEFLTRHTHDIRDHIKKQTKREVGFFNFALDIGERNRERISDLLEDTAESHGAIPKTLHD